MSGKQKAKVVTGRTAIELEHRLEEFLNRESVTYSSVSFTIQTGDGYWLMYHALVTYTYNDGVKRG